MITGPFRDRAKKGQPKQWYLRVSVPVIGPDGNVILDDKGRVKKRRERPYYETQQDAKADIPRLEAQHHAAGATSGGTLSREVVADVEEARKIVPEASLAEIARFWRKHHPLQATLRVKDHVDTVLAQIKARCGEGSKQHEDMRSRLGIFVKTFGERIPETITRTEVLAWLFSYPGRAKSARTLANLKQCVCSFFNGLRAAGAVTHNPAGGIRKHELPRIVPKEKRFLSLEESERYLRACERYDPELVAHEVVQFVAGVRADDEMANFDGAWVLPATREIVIPAEIAKTGVREVITEVEPIFWEWWAVYGRTGLLRPRSYTQRWTRVRMLARISDREKADELARVSLHHVEKHPEAKAAVKAWPWNARRRTFATFHVAAKQSAAQTALIMRHRGDPYTLHNSYRGTGVTQAQGVEYFTRRPQKVAEPIAPAAAKMPPRGIVRKRLEARARRGA